MEKQYSITSMTKNLKKYTASVGSKSVPAEKDCVYTTSAAKKKPKTATSPVATTTMESKLEV